jgi:uncharacterized membrane protein
MKLSVGGIGHEGSTMATLTVWKFPTPGGAEEAEHTLERLQKEELIVVEDAAIVSWPEEAKKPMTRQMNNLKAGGALGGSFWGLLFGLLFFVPLLGIAVGAAVGALAGSLTDVGINDEFILRVREQVKPGTSALFVMTSDAVLDKVHEAFEGQQMQLLQTNLSGEQEARLRDAFGS